MKVYIARHGEYQNPDGVAPYRLPGFPLTQLGISQAQLQANKLKDQKVRAIYTSPIQRCVETATIISQHLHLFPNQKPELIETSTPLAGIKKIDMPPDIYLDARHIEGEGETMEAIFTRMSSFIDTLKRTSKNSNYLVISHGDPVMIFLHGVLKKDVRYIPMGGLVMLDYNQKGIPKYTEII
ncbi:MAG: histidine phosphatase family protein [Microgenomates group bacterium]